jgi:intracellular septation protein
MSYLLDLLPVILFFITFRVAEADKAGAAAFASEHFGAFVSGGSVSASEAPVLLATLVVILATTAQVIWLKARRQHVKPTLWFSLGLVVVLGSLTIWLHDENFIKWKPTLIDWVFALALGLSPVFTGKNLVKRMLGGQMRLPDAIWRHLAVAWTVFFASLGGANLWVAYHFDTATWVNFKLFGATGLILLFMLAQGYYLSRHVISDEPDAPVRADLPPVKAKT